MKLDLPIGFPFDLEGHGSTPRPAGSSQVPAGDQLVKVEVTKETSLEALYRLAEEEVMGESEGLVLPNHFAMSKLFDKLTGIQLEVQ